MPRLGMNPARGRTSDYQPTRVTLAMLTYFPNPTGYFKDRLDVIRLSLDSLIAHTPDTDLLVFDNGSCPQLVDHLRDLQSRGLITYLLLSRHNVGKIGALQIMFNAAPGEIIAYSDDDMFFLPGWLDACLNILDTYPAVGMVSGYYVRWQMKYGNDSALKFLKRAGVRKQKGKLWPDKYEEHYLDNYGIEWEKYSKDVENIDDVRLTYKGVDALVSAQHMQFVTPRRVILEALPPTWSGRLMGQMQELDSTVDQKGFLRLSTPEPVTRFLGNVIGPEMSQMARQYGLLAKGKTVKKPRHPLWFILRSGRVNVWMWKLYNNLFDLLNSREKV